MEYGKVWKGRGVRLCGFFCPLGDALVIDRRGDRSAQDAGRDNSVGRDDGDVTPDNEAWDGDGDTGALATGPGRG